MFIHLMYVLIKRVPYLGKRSSVRKQSTVLFLETFALFLHTENSIPHVQKHSVQNEIVVILHRA